MKRIAVIGGGLSGLSAAWQLARDAQAEFTLFEASPRLGGIVETVHHRDFVIECGPDAWVTEKPWARDLATELGLDAELIPSNDAQRRTYLLQQGRLIPMPDSMRMMVPTRLDSILGSPLFTDEARRAYQREPERAAELKSAALARTQDESVADFVRRHFSDEVVRTIAGPLLSGVFGGDVETLSACAVMPAFVKMEREHGSLIAALQSRAADNAAPVFTTLRSGLGTLIRRIAATLPTCCVQLANPVLALARQGSQWRLRTADAEEMFDDVILAAPAHVARRLLRDIHSQFANLLAIYATSAIVVALAFTPGQAPSISVPPGFGYLVPQRPSAANPQILDPQILDPQLLACTFVDQKFEHRVPFGGKLLRAFFGGESAVALLNEKDDALTSLALRRLSETLGPLPPPHVAIVRRWSASLPQYAVGHLDRMAELEALVVTFPGLHLAGNAYHGIGLPDMVRIGRKAAQRALQRE